MDKTLSGYALVKQGENKIWIMVILTILLDKF